MSVASLHPRITSTAVSVASCAKINLRLDVCGRRDDGFHELRSVVVGVALEDRLDARLVETPGVHLDCSDPDLASPDNLAVRAVGELLTDGRNSSATSGIHLDLEKNIPVGGGLGGGSSNAAAALRAADLLLGLGSPAEHLARIGSRVGSDVAAFFHLPAALMTGRGENVTPLTMSWSGWVLLVQAGGPVSTAEVYASLRPEEHSGRHRDHVETICSATSAAELQDLLSNDLEAAVFRFSPRVEQAQRAIRSAGLGEFRVTGAGSVLFHLFDDQHRAREIRDSVAQLDTDLKTWIVAAPVSQQVLPQSWSK